MIVDWSIHTLRRWSYKLLYIAKRNNIISWLRIIYVIWWDSTQFYTIYTIFNIKPYLPAGQIRSEIFTMGVFPTASLMLASGAPYPSPRVFTMIDLRCVSMIGWLSFRCCLVMGFDIIIMIGWDYCIIGTNVICSGLCSCMHWFNMPQRPVSIYIQSFGIMLRRAC